MSDTDDTDDLLLIPPDFFTVNSDVEESLKLYGPYYSVVDNLISQVNTLENRIKHIEAHSDTSLLNSSFNSTNLMTGIPRFNSLEELSRPVEVNSTSTQSTPQKPRTKFKLNSLPSTPNVDTVKKSHGRLQSKYGRNANFKQNVPNSQTDVDLAEINSFISHVKNIQKHDAARNLNPVFESLTSVKKGDADKSLGEVNQISAESFKTGECVNDNSKSTTNIATEPTAKAETYWKMGDTRGSVPDRGMGMRDIMYGNETYNKKLKDYSASSATSQEPSTSDILTSAHNSESVFSDTASFSSSDSTQLTTVNRNIREGLDKLHLNAMDVLKKHRSILLRGGADTVTSPKRDSQHRSTSSVASKNKLALISLSDLWNSNFTSAGDYTRDHSKFLNKLQEEKLRRQHCEELIYQLQARALELQERLAVAVQVDGAKDEAILQIHKSWEEALAKIETLHKDKSHLEVQIAEMGSKTSNELMEAAKKISHYESESSKALNLAHNNQEKAAALEKQNALLTAEMQTYEDKLKKFEMDLARERENNQQLSKILSQKEIELNENKSVQTQASNEIAQSKRAVEICQAELTSIKAKQAQFEEKYNEALLQIKDLETDKKKLLLEIENYKKTEKNLKDELSRIKDTNEQGKADLRTFYQNQVEILVREKLKEFQQQLEKAENTLQDEMKSRELTIAKNAAAHIQQINEKNVLEIHLLEEKHKEEIKLYKLQLFQSQQEISNLQMKFHQQQERRANLVQQLQKVMEAQWLEALKIINNGKSPIVAQDKSTNTMDQLNHLKSRSYNNLEEILFREDANTVRNVPTHKASSTTNLKMFDSTSINSTTDDSYNKIVETPLTSRPDKNKHHSENELQKYVHMLLNKPTGQLNDEKYQENPENQPQTDSTKLNKGTNRDRLGKRPWK